MSKVSAIHAVAYEAPAADRHGRLRAWKWVPVTDIFGKDRMARVGLGCDFCSLEHAQKVMADVRKASQDSGIQGEFKISL